MRKIMPRKGKTGGNSLVDLEIKKRMNEAKKLQKKQEQAGIRIKNETAKRRFTKEQYPKAIGIFVYGRQFTAKIIYKGNNLLIETTKKGKLIISTLEGKKVEVTPQAKKEILKEISRIYYDSYRGGGVETVNF